MEMIMTQADLIFDKNFVIFSMQEPINKLGT